MARISALSIFLPIAFGTFFVAILAQPVPGQSLITLDKTTVSLPCPQGCASKSGSCKDDLNSKDERTVNVKISVSKTASEPVRYKYAVSGGKIIGSGSEIVWDLSDVKQGSYEILASAIDTNTKFSRPSKAVVIVQECPDCICDYDCPWISVMGPDRPVTAGESIVVTANISGGAQTSLSYRWRVSAGAIINGQDTPSITVATKTKMAGAEVTITLEIATDDDGFTYHGCPHSDSLKIMVLPKKK